MSQDPQPIRPPQASPDTEKPLAAEDLLAGSQAIHKVFVPKAILSPGLDLQDGAQAGYVQLRPLNVATLALISRAARDEPSLVPLLTIKEALVEPVVTLNQLKQFHIGLVHYLVSRINRISGLDASGEALTDVVESAYGRTHLLLAKHFGWTPEQVAQLTPGQVAVYLAGIEKLLQMERRGK